MANNFDFNGKLLINSNGNVLIGTTTDSGFKLDVAGNSRINFGSDGGIFYAQGASGNLIQLGTDGTGAYIEATGAANARRKLRMQVFNGTNDYAQFFIDGVNNYIYTSTNINFGIGSTAPPVKLRVQSAGSTFNTPDSNDVAAVSIYNSNNSSANAHAIISMRTQVSGGNPFISFDVENETGYSVGMENGSNQFRIAYGWNSLTTYPGLTITPSTSPNVLIGTTTDSGSKLRVIGGNTEFRYDQNGTSYTYLRNWGAGGSVGLLFGLSTDDDVSAELLFSQNTLYIQSYGDPGSSILFGTRNVTESAIRMKIDQDGKVGIGTTTPLSKLDVSITSTQALFIANESGTISDGDLLGAVSFGSRDGSTFSSGGITNIRSYATATYNTGSVSGDMRFYVSSSLQNTTQAALFGTEAMRIASSGNLLIGTTTDVGTKVNVNGVINASDYYFNGTSSERVVKRYVAGITIAASGYTFIANVTGSSLASAIRMTMQGTSNSVVINVLADIQVNHFQDILITTSSGFYTQLNIRIISNQNDVFSIEVEPVVAVSATTLYVEIYPLNDEVVSFSGSPQTVTTLTMLTRPGIYTVGVGGNNGTISAGGDLYVSDNAGIGTTGPTQKLHVVGAMRTQGGEVLVNTNQTSIGWVTIEPTSAIEGQIALNVVNSSGASFASIRGNGNAYFSGSVGIGTTAPAYKLDVRSITTDPVAFFGFSQTASASNGLIKLNSGRIPQGGGDFSGESGIIFGHSGGTGGVNFDGQGGYIKSIRLNTYAASAQSDSALVFATSNDNVDAEIVRITNTGNVIIGSTTDGGFKLDVHGEILGRDDIRILNTYALVLNGSDDNWRIGRNTITDSGWLTGNTTQIVVSNASSGQGFQVVNSGGTALFEVEGISGYTRISISLGVGVNPSGTTGRIDASNDIVAYSSSDLRLKENIKPIENALDKVKALTGVEFDWKAEHKEAHGYEGHDTGVIAQEVQAVMPTAVRTNDTGYLAVRYEKLIGLLIEANKELADQVANQQVQIDELKKLIK